METLRPKPVNINKTMQMIYSVAGDISEYVWGRLSGPFHLGVSRTLSKFYNTKLSKYFIRPYCKWQYKDKNYHLNFTPGSGNSDYKSFQDFFTRNLKHPPVIKSDSIWPCEGYICEVGQVQDLDLVKVKGETRHLRTIFGDIHHEIPTSHHFANVFLHNNNYHHIHAPVSGEITRIQHIPGELLLLRPWAYTKSPSLPALTNERINIDIKDKNGETWYLSIVGGPLVATIDLPENIEIGNTVKIGEKISSFALGSTCCLAAPISIQQKTGLMVAMGDSIKL